METSVLAIIAIVILSVGVVSQRLERSIITPPMLFVIAGYLVGPSGLGLIHPMVDGSVSHIIIEVTLIVILFTDGASMRICNDMSKYTIVARLLTIGMFFSVGIGLLIGVFLFPDLGFWQAALLAAILTPTDAALSDIAISYPRIPFKVRQNLRLESGLNDGMIVPVILFFSACSSLASGEHHVWFWVQYLFIQIGFGLAVGIAVGFLGGWLVKVTTHAHYMSRIFEQLSAIAMALLAFSVAETVNGNGLVASFVAGLTFGRIFHHISSAIHDFVEAQSQLLALVSFMLFGAIIAAPALQTADWRTFVYAILSLTVIRMTAVTLSLIGTSLKSPSWLFFGWMGPRGIASMLFGLVVLETLNISQREEIFTTVVATELLSIFFHGLTAMPISKWYARHIENDIDNAPCWEKDDKLPLV